MASIGYRQLLQRSTGADADEEDGNGRGRLSLVQSLARTLQGVAPPSLVCVVAQDGPIGIEWETGHSPVGCVAI